MSGAMGCLRRSWLQPAINRAASRRFYWQGGPDRHRVHTSVVTLAGQEYRRSQGLARSGTEYGPLTDLPDWSFVDGRPAPISKATKKRKGKQYTISKRVQQLLKEVDLAKISKERVKINKKESEGAEMVNSTATVASESVHLNSPADSENVSIARKMEPSKTTGPVKSPVNRCPSRPSDVDM